MKRAPSIQIPLLTLPVFIFSRCFAAFPLIIDRYSLRHSVVGTFCTLIALTLCLGHLIFLPGIVMRIERKLADAKAEVSYNYMVKMSFPGVVFITAVFNRCNSIIFLQSNLSELMVILARVDTRLKIGRTEKIRHFYFSKFVLCIISLLTFPINLVRLRLFYIASDTLEPMIMFADMYYQNISNCSNEMQFVTITYGLILRLRKVNRHLEEMRDQQDNIFLMRHRKRGPSPPPWYFGTKKLPNLLDGLGLKDKSNLNLLAELRQLHKQICDAIVSLQKAYELSILMSIFCLCFIFLFDVYFEFYGFIGGNAAKPSLATYLWCTQYSTRFTILMETSQKLYDEGVRTKHLLSNLNNRYLDDDTKEEIALFMNHITNSKIEFTACDFFTLNTRLITSAIAAGTTYLVILVQFHSDKE